MAASKLSDHGVGMGDSVSTTLAPGYWWISTGRSLPWLTLTKARGAGDRRAGASGGVGGHAGTPAQASDDAGPTVTAAGPTSPDTDKPRGPHGPLHQPAARALRSADGDRVTSSAPAALGWPTSAPTSMVPQPPWASTFGPWQHRCRGAT